MYLSSKPRVFLFQEQKQKKNKKKQYVFKAFRKAKMQMFPPAPAIVAPTRDT